MQKILKKQGILLKREKKQRKYSEIARFFVQEIIDIVRQMIAIHEICMAIEKHRKKHI